MVRKFVRKTDRAAVPEFHILQAVRRVVISKDCLKRVSKEMDILRRTLQRYCSKASKLPDFEKRTSIEDFAGYKCAHKVGISILFHEYSSTCLSENYRTGFHTTTRV